MTQQSAGALVQPLIILLVSGYFLLIFVIPRFADTDFTAELECETGCVSYVESSSLPRGFFGLDFESELALHKRYGRMQAKDILEKLKEDGNTFIENGKYEEAIPVLKEIHKLQTEILGSKDKETVTTLENLAGLNALLRKYDEALAGFQRVYKIKEKTLGPTHSEIFTTIQKLALVHHKKGNYGKALGFLKVIYKQRKRLLGPNHVGTMEILFLLGNSLWKADQSPGTKEKVLKYYKKVYKIYTRTWGENDETLSVLFQMGKCLVGLKRFEKAVPIFQTVLKKRLQPDSDSDLDSSGSTENFLGWSLLQLGRMKEAQAVYQKAASSNFRKSEKLKQADNSESKIISILNLAKVAMAEENYEEALEKLEQLNSMVQKHNHPKLEQVLQDLINVHDALNNFTKAFEISIQLFHVVQNKSGSGPGNPCQKVSIASAWDVVFNQFLLILEKHPKLDSEDTILLPEFFKIVDFVVTNLRDHEYSSEDDDSNSQADENLEVLKAFAMAAFLAEEQEIATNAAAKLVRILKRQRNDDQKSKPSKNDEKKENSKINKEINIFQKMLNVKKLWGNINKKEL